MQAVTQIMTAEFIAGANAKCGMLREPNNGKGWKEFEGKAGRGI